MLIPVGDRWALFATALRPDLPVRTQYWIGSFDGTRFRPDDPEPRQYDMLATLRAPSIALGPDGELFAVGIIADELQDEPMRHAAGWVHVLGLAVTLRLCPEDGLQLCAAFAPGLADRFNRALDLPPPSRSLEVDTKGKPTLLRFSVATKGEGEIKIVLRQNGAGASGAVLTLDPVTGDAVLDYSDGPLLPLMRPARIIGQLAPAKLTEVSLIIDGAAISGTVNGKPFGFLVFAPEPGHDTVRIETLGGAVFWQAEVRQRN